MLIDTPEYAELCNTVGALKKQGKVIVLATGVFDLLHDEHKNYLQKAKAAGDMLIVAIESDKRTRELKGEGRPVHSQQARLSNVSDLWYVDEAFILPDDFNSPAKYEQLIADLQPNIYACSSHSPYQDAKREMVEKYGGDLVIVHAHNPEVSTTKRLTQAQLTELQQHVGVEAHSSE